MLAMFTRKMKLLGEFYLTQSHGFFIEKKMVYTKIHSYLRGEVNRPQMQKKGIKYQTKIYTHINKHGKYMYGYVHHQARSISMPQFNLSILKSQYDRP